MISSTPFALVTACVLAALAVMAGLVFRHAREPLASRLALPAIAVAGACLIPYAANTVAGFPSAALLTDLPACFTLAAFVAGDENEIVDLWVEEGGTPRSYAVALSPQLKTALRQLDFGNGPQHVCQKGGQVKPASDSPGSGGTGAGQGRDQRAGAEGPGLELDPRYATAAK